MYLLVYSIDLLLDLGESINLDTSLVNLHDDQFYVCLSENEKWNKILEFEVCTVEMAGTSMVDDQIANALTR